MFTFGSGGSDEASLLNDVSRELVLLLLQRNDMMQFLSKLHQFRCKHVRLQITVSETFVDDADLSSGLCWRHPWVVCLIFSKRICSPFTARGVRRLVEQSLYLRRGRIEHPDDLEQRGRVKVVQTRSQRLEEAEGGAGSGAARSRQVLRAHALNDLV